MNSITSRYKEEQKKTANLFRALGHPARIAIIEAIAKRKSCVDNEIVTIDAIGQSATLEHMVGLRKAGLIKGSFNTTSDHSYCINWDKMVELKNKMDELCEVIKHNQKNVLEQDGKCIK